MQVFNCFYKIIKKNIGGLLLYFGIFIGLAILMSNITSGTEMSSFEETKIQMAVIDRDNSELSKALKEYMGARQNLVAVDDDKEKMQDNLFARKVEYILIIPPHFEEKLKSGEEVYTENIKVPGSYTGFFADSQVNQYLKSLKTYIAAGYGVTDAAENVEEDLNIKGQVTLQGDSVKADMPSIYYYLRYIPYALMAVLIYGISPALRAFQNRDLKKRNECGAMTLNQRNKQIMAACVVFSTIVWGVFMIAAVVLYREQLLDGNIKYGILNTMAFLLVAASIAFMVGMLVRSDNALTALVNIISLGFCFMGGVFVPQEIMSEKVLAFCKFVPSFWYVRVNDLLGESIGITEQIRTDVWLGILVQVGFASVIFALTLVLIKKMREC
ncbi:MAG: ABC transporter permease [Clostridiales bacterium]|nr:ABC transporter permease [Clostridiales bacterium]MDU3239346.1 ABC transporter permease [Clostridiales bacterium]